MINLDDLLDSMADDDEEEAAEPEAVQAEL